MPVDVRTTNRALIEEMEDLDNAESRDKEVSFFLPNSRRQSEEDATNSASRPRSFAINHDASSEFLLFHTFQLTSQSGPSQIAILPKTASTGSRILAACRDESLRCMYFSVQKELLRKDEVIVAPRNVSMSSIPIDKPWKIGALSCLPHDLGCKGSMDVIAFLTYCQPAPKGKESELDKGPPPKPVLTVAWMDPNDINLDNPVLANVELPFNPHGCNQLTWWKEPRGSDRDAVVLLMPSQEGPVYCSQIYRTLGDEKNLQVLDVAALIPIFTRINYRSSMNALEYYDFPSHNRRIIATSVGPRSSVCLWSMNLSEVVAGEESSVEVEGLQVVWKVQHDSMTSRMKFFATDPGKDTVCFLVIGLLELVVVYRNVLREASPVSTVLPRSLDHDVVTCSEVIPAAKGKPAEIVLGTYSRVVLIYGLEEDSAVLLRILETPCPLYYVSLQDMALSDERELVVVTQKGVQVYSLRS